MHWDHDYDRDHEIPRAMYALNQMSSVSYYSKLSAESQKLNHFLPLTDPSTPTPQHRDGAVYILCIIYEECLRYHTESSSALLSGLPIFLPLNVNGKTDSGTDGCSSSLVRRSRWEVSASQHHIHFPFHSSCKSKLADFLCLHIFLSPFHLLNFIISWGGTSCSLINYLKNVHSLSRIARLVNILLLQHGDPAGNALRGLKFGANTAMKLTCCGWSRMNFGIA